MWSMGCTLYELYTGKILFPGRSNNQMLFMMQELKGKFTAKQARRGKFGEVHFDETNTFLLHEVDRATGQVSWSAFAKRGVNAAHISSIAADYAESRLFAAKARPQSSLGGTIDDVPAAGRRGAAAEQLC